MVNKEFVVPSEEELQSNLPTWKKKPKLSALKDDLTSAISSHATQKAKIQVWLDNLNIEGAAKVKTAPGSSSVVPQLIRKHAEWRYAALTEPFMSTSDLLNVKPVTWEDRDAALQNQILLNNQFHHALDKQKFIDELIRTAVDEGTVIMRTGWAFEEKEVEETVPVANFIPDPSFEPVLMEVMQMRDASPSQFQTDVPDELKMALEMSEQDGVIYRPEIVGEETRKVMKTVKNHPTVDICDYRNVLIDPTCQGDIEKAQFVIYSFETSISELRKDKRYTNLDYINLNVNNVLAQGDHAVTGGSNSFEFQDEPRKKLVVYEYWGFWDYDDSGIAKPVVVSWVGDVIIRMEESPYPDGKLPFVVIQYLPVRRSIYGEPDGALLEDNQKIIGAITRGTIDILGKSANAQTGFSKGFLDQTNKNRFDQGLDYEFNFGTDPRQAVFMHKFEQIPESALAMLNLQTLDAESLTGVKAYGQGIASNSLGDVAAGIRGALDAASKRELGILRRISHGVIQVARKFMAMNAVFLSDEEVIRVTNTHFIKVRREDLSGEFDLDLTISTAEEDNNKAQELAFMMQTMGNNMDHGMRTMIMSDIARLRKMPDLAHKIEEYQPAPDPMQEKMMQLELMKLELELAKMQAEINKVNASANLDVAKAGEIQSTTDLNSLEYVETESGVKQERNLELQGAQARAQTEMKIVDHQLKMQQADQKALHQYMLDRANNKDKPASSTKK